MRPIAKTSPKRKKERNKQNLSPAQKTISMWRVVSFKAQALLSRLWSSLRGPVATTKPTGHGQFCSLRGLLWAGLGSDSSTEQDTRRESGMPDRLGDIVMESVYLENVKDST